MLFELLKDGFVDPLALRRYQYYIGIGFRLGNPKLN
jgi:hypothetical protein